MEDPGRRQTPVLRIFTPHLEILPPAQRQLWNALAAVPGDFVLYGGTAVALHLAHRISRDFDFFGCHRFDPDSLYAALPFLAEAEILQKSENTQTCLVTRGGEVRISFFGVPGLGRIHEPLISADIGLHVADLADLAGTKAAVVQKRAEAKDYIDLDAILTQAGLSLEDALIAAHHIYGSTFNPLVTLKALSYFADGDLPTLPSEIRQRLMQAAHGIQHDRLLQMLDHLPPDPETKGGS